MNRYSRRLIGVLGPRIALVVLLTFMTACSAQPVSSPPAVSPQTPVKGMEQDAPPTPEFDTTEVEPDSQLSPGDLEPSEQSTCPDLDSMLFQITQAPDSLDLAEQLQLKVKEDKILVLLILDGEDLDFLQDYGVEVGKQVGTQVQAFVPIDQLCDLANTTEVLSIRPPAQAVPQ